MKRRKSMKKILLPIVTAMILVFAMSISALAELVPALKDYNCTFTTGQKLESNFKTSDIYNQFAGMQPGDYTDIVIDIKNDNENTVDWYMTNKVIKSLEDTRDADALSGGAYTYILTYKGNNCLAKVPTDDKCYKPGDKVTVLFDPTEYLPGLIFNGWDWDKDGSADYGFFYYEFVMPNKDVEMNAVCYQQIYDQQQYHQDNFVTRPQTPVDNYNPPIYPDNSSSWFDVGGVG